MENKQFDLYEDRFWQYYTTEEPDNFNHRVLVATSNEDGIITAFGYYYGEDDDMWGLNFNATFESLVEQAKEEASEDIPLIKVVEYEFYIAYNGELEQREKRVERIKYEG